MSQVLALPKSVNVDDAFPDADLHEATLFKAALLRWLMEIEQKQVPVKREGNENVYLIDLRYGPVVEINDGCFVRQFTVEVGDLDGEIRYALSDPMRRVDLARDPIIDDHVTVIYPRGRSESAVPLPERILGVASMLIPRRHREGLVGDLREDLNEMRENGSGERTMACIVLWQLAIVVFRKIGPLVGNVLVLTGIRRTLRHWLAK